MNKFISHFFGVLALVLLTNSAVFSQTVSVSGSVKDNLSGQPLAGVAVVIKGSSAGTSTNDKGQFALTPSLKAPITLVFSYIGYKTVEQMVNENTSALTITMETQSILGQEVVVAASRTPERILESPVSIERVGAAAIRATAAPSFYDALANLKGVESSAQSLTFRSLNTRGFNANGNVRFNQYVDGMDNQAPGLNFSVGNVVGISELDVESAELLPGAASALYGAGGTNGTLILTSKSPFTSPGLSMMIKGGANHVDNFQTGRSEFRDIAVRYAKVWNNHFAFKTNVSLLQAQDWEAQDYSNFDRIAQGPKSGTRQSDPRYDGINIYGDEPNAAYPTLMGVAQTVQDRTRAGILAATGNTVDIVQTLNTIFPGIPTQAQLGGFVNSLPAALRPAVQNMLPFYVGLKAGVIPGQSVTRTGYMEKDLVDYNTHSFKTSNSLHYKFTNSIEGIVQANWGSGTSVYTGSDRYSLRNFNVGQYKIELKGTDFFVRAYTVQERSGDAYNATLLGTYMNEYSRSSLNWFPDYTGAFTGSKLQGATDEQAHSQARAFADRFRPVPGSAQFNALKETITSKTIGPAGGAKFNDKTNMYHYEGMYNFINALKNVVELQVGSSFRRYLLRSDGTIFDDLNQKLSIDEFGGFVQAGKKIFNNKLKLTGAVRYDKNENFEGQFTPRLAGVFTVAENNNIRVSYQSGFRNPTTQDQYIDLLVGGSAGVRLIGGLNSQLDKYNLRTNKGYTLTSIRAGAPQQYTFDRDFKPESVQAYEIGYKGLIQNKLLFDAYYYYNSYKNFISSIILLQPGAPSATDPLGLGSAKTFSTVVNNPDKVESQGAAFGLDYIMGKFNLSGNVSYNELKKTNSALENQFNTPKYRFNLGLSNREVVKNLGFNINYRWQEKYTWNSTFAVGEVPAFGTLDAQASIKLPDYKTTFKIGGSNILNKYYRTSFGNPQIGAMYYVSMVFDQFLK